MRFSSDFKGRAKEISDLFKATFTASEGPDEGELIGTLASDLMSVTPDDDLHVFIAEEAGKIVGAIVFSRLRYDRDDRSVFVLGPVAVATEKQGQGIGQELLRHGLRSLRGAGVDMAITYGDPTYYCRVGFAPITETFAAAPFGLQHPEGWLGQSLTDRPITPLKGKCTCVAAFDDPVFW